MPTTRAPSTSSLFRDLIGLCLALALCWGVAALGAWATMPAIPTWYANLEKPAWSPPNAVFGPVWSALYTMMAIAAWLVWRQGRPGYQLALAAFAVQLACNALWSWLFFGWQMPGVAFLDIVALWLSIVATMVLFARHSRFAAWLMAPYLAWVSFAAALNFALWRLNA